MFERVCSHTQNLKKITLHVITLELPIPDAESILDKCEIYSRR